ncbi:DUF3888 domain-containing protein [Brevibacillus daliensis]|uniref:DUF3888 domain-containing protein n=1 Tax=Brevibacillus daliensis TaxID=2892995 RepID=UPI001E3F5E48|nr:DUF3888 domain-containing protein [Brevibacillus daliensis]
MKKYVIAITLAIIALFPIFPIGEASSIPLYPKGSPEELYQDIFITMLGPSIEKAVHHYYSDILTTSPHVYPYEVKVIKAERIGGYRKFGFTVVLMVSPVIGPHIGVGQDQLTFSISPGKTRLIKYEHLRTEELPPHWQHIIKY